MKKLALNKQAIAHLDYPNRVFGGEGEAAPGPPLTQVGVTCVGNTCPSCDGGSKYPYDCGPLTTGTV